MFLEYTAAIQLHFIGKNSL